jgi:serine/threonine protein kinase
MNHPAAPRLDGFEFLEYLGGGTFGQVWKVRDTKMDVFRAVKVLHKNLIPEADAQRLLKEAQTMAKLPRHRNRVAVHYFKEGVTNSFLVMDYVAGGALSRLTCPGRPIPWGRVARWVAGVADALLDVHAQAIVHLDVKPANILWEPDTDEALLCDFGIAAALDRANRVGGTSGYIAPEVYRGAAGPKSDVYSLAMTLLHLATGERPREGVRPCDHGGWGSLPAELREVIRAGAEPEPERRPDAATFLGQLREARWKALTERMFAAQSEAPAAVRLQATAAVADADRPTDFRPLRHGGRLVPAATGDFVKIEAQATADGYFTVLVLASSGELVVGLPCPTQPDNRFRAGQRCSLIFRLTPPAGTERVLILWSAAKVERDASRWRRWVERAGISAEDGEAGAGAPAVRGVEMCGVHKGPAPEGDCRMLVIPVAHVAPG